MPSMFVDWFLKMYTCPKLNMLCIAMGVDALSSPVSGCGFKAKSLGLGFQYFVFNLHFVDLFL